MLFRIAAHGCSIYSPLQLYNWSNILVPDITKLVLVSEYMISNRCKHQYFYHGIRCSTRGLFYNHNSIIESFDRMDAHTANSKYFQLEVSLIKEIEHVHFLFGQRKINSNMSNIWKISSIYVKLKISYWIMTNNLIKNNMIEIRFIVRPH